MKSAYLLARKLTHTLEGACLIVCPSASHCIGFVGPSVEWLGLVKISCDDPQLRRCGHLVSYNEVLGGVELV